MVQKRRGPDRRAGPGQRGQAIYKNDRRSGVDRRRHGYISSLDICRGLDYEMLEPVLEKCPIRNLEAGETLIEQGQSNHHLYIVLEGRLDVHLESTSTPVVDVINVGECTGEMSIIDGKPTSAIVSAGIPSRIMAIHEDVFWTEVGASRVAMRNLSRILAERMRRRNEAVLHSLQQEVRLEQLEKELAAAHDIQVGMLPESNVVLGDFPSLDVYGRTAVAESVGGDFYDAFQLDGNRLCVAIGDVSGKGMPAALFMVKAVTLLRVELHKNTDLVTAMSQINRELCETRISYMFVSLIVAVLDVKSRTLTYVNAGHPPFLVAQDGSPYMSIESPPGIVAGVFDDVTYEAGVLKLAPGTSLLFYTDGVMEARNPGRSMYGTGRLSTIVDNNSSSEPKACVEALFDDVHSFTAGAPQSDDITILAVKLRG